MEVLVGENRNGEGYDVTLKGVTYRVHAKVTAGNYAGELVCPVHGTEAKTFRRCVEIESDVVNLVTTLSVESPKTLSMIEKAMRKYLGDGQISCDLCQVDEALKVAA